MTKIKKTVMIILFLCLAFFQSATSLKASNEKRTVRVGYIDLPMFTKKTGDHFSGYCVEYLNEICKYVDWEIEYVEATIERQFQMIETGELDIVPLAQKTKEREEKFFFSSHPMGNTQCVLVVEKDNQEYYFDDFEEFDGKRIAVQKGSINVELLKQYAELNFFSYEEILCNTLDEAISLMENGGCDIVAGSDQMINSNNVKMVGCFGYEPYYFMLSKNDVSLLREIDYALDLIFANDNSYVHKLYDKYYGATSLNTTPTFTRDEIDLINSNKKDGKKIDIAFITDSQPDGYYDEKGNVIGILPDILDMVSEISGLEFNYSFCPGNATPLEYIKNNPNVLACGVLITNPAFQSSDVVVTNQLYSGYSGLFVNKDLREIDIENKNYKIGIQTIFQAMNIYVRDNYPNLTIVNDYETIEANLNALDEGKIDLVAYDVNMVLHYWGNPRYQNIRIVSTSFLEEKQGMVGVNNPYNQTIINIINKCRSLIPNEKISIIERNHVSENFYTPTLKDVFYRLRYPLIISGLLCLIIIALLILENIKSQKNKNNIAAKNKELKVLVQKLKIANNAKNDFLSCMSHDIRTPMNAILGMTKIALANGNKPKRMTECLKKINYSAIHLTSLINDILDISKIESGKMSLKNSEFSLVDSITLITNTVRNMALEKNINLSVHMHNCLQEKLFGDELKINQICINLLSNAVKYTSKGGDVVCDFYQEEADDIKVLFKIVIKDNGIGMSEEFQKTMYNSFERATDSRSTNIQGSGLGLFICKKFTEIMDGDINCESTIGIGTTFTVSLKLEKVNEDNDYNLPPLNVLIIDHDQVSTNSFNNIASKLGVNCDIINNYDDIYTLINKDNIIKYDLAFIEMGCPENKGLEIAKYIKNIASSDFKVVLTDIADMLLFGEEIDEAKINHTMNKPYFYSKVYNIINEVISSDSIVKEKKEKTSKIFKGMNVLIAEDNDINYEILDEILKMYGISNQRAENGLACYEMLLNSNENDFDAVLMDVRMPIMDGIEATKKIRSEDGFLKTIPIIAMTADAFYEDVKKCFDAGMDSHLQKPLNFNKLLKMLEKIKKGEKIGGGYRINPNE